MKLRLVPVFDNCEKDYEKSSQNINLSQENLCPDRSIFQIYKTPPKMAYKKSRYGYGHEFHSLLVYEIEITAKMDMSSSFNLKVLNEPSFASFSSDKRASGRYIPRMCMRYRLPSMVLEQGLHRAMDDPIYRLGYLVYYLNQTRR